MNSKIESLKREIEYQRKIGNFDIANILYVYLDRD
jgi:hypothetical protein